MTAMGFLDSNDSRDSNTNMMVSLFQCS